MNPGTRTLLVMAALALVPVAASSAQPPVIADPSALPRLKPGQSIWFETPEFVRAGIGPASPVRLVVAIRQQQALVYRGERLVAVTTVSTGAPGYATPLGEFAILEKKVFHRSNLYSNAPMPHMQRLTWGGIALHAGPLPGYPASHGCIRLPKEFARQLYDLTEKGGSVLIVNDVADAPFAVPLAPLLTADMRGLHTVGTSYAAPRLVAETRDLGGAAYDVLTMSDAPAEQGRTQRGAR